MNIIEIPYETLQKVTHQKPDLSKMIVLVGLSQLSIPEFHVTTTPLNGYVNLIDFQFELVNYEDLPSGIMGEYVPPGKIIKFINHYEKKDPNINIYHTEANNEAKIIEEAFEPLGLYIHPQIIYKNGKRLFDLYAEPIEGHGERFNRFSNEQLNRRSITALNLLHFVESKLKKERHIIKRIMPTPEQIAQADKSGKPYESKTIVIKDISIRYVYEPHETKRYERHCEAWGVRGHYRHYKSGKVVYVRPHIKGTGRKKTTVYKFE